MTDQKPGLIDLASVTPRRVLLWGLVGFAYCGMILLIVAAILAMFGVYG